MTVNEDVPVLEDWKIRRSKAFDAIASDDANTLQDLLDEGLKVWIENEQGDHLLHAAASLGAIGCIKILLAKGADPEARDNAGFTARDRAISFNAQQLMQQNTKQRIFRMPT